MGYEQLKSDPAAKREERRDDSILLRHMDDVVRTGPEEHLMRDIERMKTSLLLTNVVVLRNTGGRVNILCLKITRTRRGFEERNNRELVEPLLSL